MGSVSCSSLYEQCNSVLMNREKCKALQQYLKRANDNYDPRACDSAQREFRAAEKRAQHLVDESSDDTGKWLLKAMELWECSEHFVEVFVDLCWSARIMVTFYRSETDKQERVRELSQEQERLLNSRRSTPTLLETEHKNDKDEMCDEVNRILNSPDLQEGGDEFQLVHLLNDRIKGQKSWHPPVLTSYKFDLKIIFKSSNPAKRGGDGIVLPFKWVYKKRFAVKMCHPGTNHFTFEHEYKVLDEHRSPYIVGVVGRWDLSPVSRWRPWKHTVPERPFLVMEAMDYNLEELISRYRKSRRGQGFSVRETITLMLPVSKALRFLHAKRVAHRDVKLQNIMCSNVASGNIDDVIVKLVDFGAARKYVSRIDSDYVFVANNSGALYLPGSAGTNGFKAPEMRSPNGCKNLERADVFSFVMVFVELLTWRREETCVQVQVELNRGVRATLPKDLPSYIHFIVESCWSEEPYTRPSFNHICSMLENAKLLISDPRFGEGDDPFSYRDATFATQDYKKFRGLRGFPL